MGCDVVLLLELFAAEIAGELIEGIGVVLLHVPVEGGFLTAGEAADLTLEGFLSRVDASVDDEVAAGPEGAGTELADVISFVAVQLLVFLEVFLEVEGFPTAGLRAGEGLLVDVLVFLMVIEILPVGEDLPAALEVAEEDLTFGCFPDPFGADLGHVFIARMHWMLVADSPTLLI